MSESPFLQTSSRTAGSCLRRYLLLLVPILLALGGFFILFRTVRLIELQPADGSEGYKIWLRPSLNERRDEIAGELRSRFKSLAIQNNTARLQAGGGGKAVGNRLQDSAGNNITSELTLTMTGDTFSLGEYHGGTLFTVRRITPEGVILSYTHTFSGYNGMGGQLVSQDKGEITLTPFGNP